MMRSLLSLLAVTTLATACAAPEGRRNTYLPTSDTLDVAADFTPEQISDIAEAVAAWNHLGAAVPAYHAVTVNALTNATTFPAGSRSLVQGPSEGDVGRTVEWFNVKIADFIYQNQIQTRVDLPTITASAEAYGVSARDMFRSTVVHELGHQIGLPHVVPTMGAWAVMTEYVSGSPEMCPQAADREAFCDVYHCQTSDLPACE